MKKNISKVYNWFVYPNEINRKDFCVAFLKTILIMPIFLVIISPFIFLLYYSHYNLPTPIVIFSGAILFVFYMSAAIFALICLVRAINSRLRDLELSIFFTILTFIPFFGNIFLFYLIFKKGKIKKLDKEFFPLFFTTLLNSLQLIYIITVVAIIIFFNSIVSNTENPDINNSIFRIKLPVTTWDRLDTNDGKFEYLFPGTQTGVGSQGDFSNTNYGVNGSVGVKISTDLTPESFVKADTQELGTIREDVLGDTPIFFFEDLPAISISGEFHRKGIVGKVSDKIVKIEIFSFIEGEKPLINELTDEDLRYLLSNVKSK